MDKLTGFVPAALLQAIQTGRGDEPVDIRIRGTALFADIADYTALAEDLCGRGTAGLEALARFLDRAFRGYVGCVHAAGGEVACFAGDALVAYWSAEDGDEAGALDRAKECARLLHNVSILDLPAGTSTRTLHVGIASGSMWAARLGGAAAGWHLLLSGQAVRDASKAAAEAPPGETVVASARGRSTGAGASGVDAATSRANAAVAGDRIEDFVPRVIREWIAGGYEEWLPQVRPVCALIVRIEGLDSERPDALERHQEAIAAAMTAIRPYTGSSGALVFDDKGLLLKICLGLPHDSHADDAIRAARAGLAIERELDRLGLRSAAGLASGHGVCMPVGGPERRHYVAVGRFMHVAARLMQHAGQGLLCTSEIADRIRGEFTLSPEGRVHAKGVKGPLRPFRVGGVSGRAERSERLFGREFEMRQLNAQLDALEQGEGRVVWVVGDAGLGKTALIRHFCDVARARGFSPLIGGAASVDTAVPYLAWRTVFAAALHDKVPERAAAKRERLLKRMRHPKLASLVNAVLPGTFDESASPGHSSRDASADAIVRVLSETLAVCAPVPTLLVLEDCHWMDSASWRLLQRIAQDFPSALLLLTSRPGVQGRELEWLRELERFLELKLSPLRKDAVARLIEDLVAPELASDDLVDEIAQRSGCNPLFVHEYALLVESTRRLDREAQSLQTAAAPPGRPLDAFPETVEGLIASRLDALSPDDEVVLKAASILGDEFPTSLLAGICERELGRADLGTTLAGLVRAELLIETSAHGASYAFRHALIRKGAYAQLTPAQRCGLHRAAAESLERRFEHDLAPHVAALAHHWLEADVPDRGVRYAGLAAAQALAAGAYLEADRLLGVCLDLDERLTGLVDLDTSVRWLTQTAEARRGLGQLESRSAAARRALVRAGARRPEKRLLLAVQAAGKALKLAARQALPRKRSPAQAPLALELAQAYRHSAEVCYFNNDMIGMICDSISSVAWAEAAPPSAVLASASTELGGVLAIAGFRHIGERILRRATAVAATAGDHGALAYAHLVTSLYAVGTGDWPSAERSAHFCQELCDPMDDTVNWTNAQAIRFWLAHHQGRLDDAEEIAHRLLDRALETGNRQHQAWALRYLAQCELRRGRFDDAAERLTAALERLGETAALNERIPAIALLSLALLRAGQVWAARAKARDGLALIGQVRRPIGHSVLEGYSALAEVVFDAWRQGREASDWHREARRCLRLLRKYRAAFPIGEPRYWFWRGRYAELTGRARAAAGCYRRSEAAGRRFAMPWDQARAAAARETLKA